MSVEASASATDGDVGTWSGIGSGGGGGAETWSETCEAMMTGTGIAPGVPPVMMTGTAPGVPPVMAMAMAIETASRLSPISQELHCWGQEGTAGQLHACGMIECQWPAHLPAAAVALAASSSSSLASSYSVSNRVTSFT